MRVRESEMHAVAHMQLYVYTHGKPHNTCTCTYMSCMCYLISFHSLSTPHACMSPSTLHDCPHPHCMTVPTHTTCLSPSTLHACPHPHCMLVPIHTACLSSPTLHACPHPHCMLVLTHTACLSPPTPYIFLWRTFWYT